MSAQSRRLAGINETLRCKAGDLAFITGSRLNLGRIVLVKERGPNFEGRPTWLIVAQGAPLVVPMYDGSSGSVFEWWAVDAVLRPIRPGDDEPAEKIGKRTTVVA